MHHSLPVSHPDIISHLFIKTKAKMPSAAVNNMDIFQLGGSMMDAHNISQEDVDKLKSLLPAEYQHNGNLTQLEIIIEAIHYIKELKLQLHY